MLNVVNMSACVQSVVPVVYVISECVTTMSMEVCLSLAGCNQSCTESKSIWMVKGEYSVWSHNLLVLEGGQSSGCYCILYISC